MNGIVRRHPFAGWRALWLLQALRARGDLRARGKAASISFALMALVVASPALLRSCCGSPPIDPGGGPVIAACVVTMGSLLALVAGAAVMAPRWDVMLSSPIPHGSLRAWAVLRFALGAAGVAAMAALWANGFSGNGLATFVASWCPVMAAVGIRCGIDPWLARISRRGRRIGAIGAVFLLYATLIALALERSGLRQRIVARALEGFAFAERHPWSLLLAGAIVVTGVILTEARRIADLREGGLASLGASPSERERAPSWCVPRWGGLGPHVTAFVASRQMRKMTAVQIAAFLVSLPVLAAGVGAMAPEAIGLSALLLSTIAGFVGLFLMGGAAAPWPLLATLPQRPRSVVLGMLLAPVMLASTATGSMLGVFALLSSSPAAALPLLIVTPALFVIAGCGTWFGTRGNQATVVILLVPVAMLVRATIQHLRPTFDMDDARWSCAAAWLLAAMTFRAAARAFAARDPPMPSGTDLRG